MRSEYLEGRVFCSWLRSRGLRFSHIANESSSSREALAKKRRGMAKGVPDYVIVLPTVVLWVELKRAKGGRVSSEQREWCEALTVAGTPAKVCRGAAEAQMFVEEYL